MHALARRRQAAACYEGRGTRSVRVVAACACGYVRSKNTCGVWFIPRVLAVAKADTTVDNNGGDNKRQRQ